MSVSEKCRANQMSLCYDASHQATIEMMARHLERMTTQRTILVQAWRDAGKTDDAWKAIEDLDVVLDKQEKILLEMEGRLA